MGPPSTWMWLRQVVGRALRETGQMIDRVGVRGKQHATTKRVIGDDPYVFDDHFSRHRHLFPILTRGKPIVSPQVAYVAPNTSLIGSVRVGPGASIWYGAVLRADSCNNGSSFKRRDDEAEMNYKWEIPKKLRSDEEYIGGGGIFIGENSNVQDGCLVTARANHTVVGKGVTIGHLAQIHSATVKDHCLIGMGSVLLEGVVVEEESFVAAGAVVKAGTVIPSGELWVGNPAHKVRDLTDKERAKLHYQADEYVKVALGQRGVMELGGNLPDSLLKYTMLGSGAEEVEPSLPVAAGTLKSPFERPPEPESDDDDDEEKLPGEERVHPSIIAKLPPLKILPFEDDYMSGAALRKHIERQKLTSIARQRLEAAEARMKLLKAKTQFKKK